MSDSVAAIILAAGKGTRMKSDLPKGLHPVGGVPMVGLVGRALQGAGVKKPIVVIGHLGDLVQSALGDDDYEFVWQTEMLGTGHAAMMAAPNLADHQGITIIAPGDAPLVTETVFSALIETHRASGAACTLATTVVADPKGYGRVIRDGNVVSRIVEHKNASDEERAVREIAVSIYCFDTPALLSALDRLTVNDVSREYYLTDVIEILRADGLKTVPHEIDDPDLVAGVNDRWQLAQCEKTLRMRILRYHAERGVTIRDPDSTYIESSVQIAPNVTLEPGTILRGKTTIAEGCAIGPYSVIGNSVILNDTRIVMSQVYEATIGARVHIGPFANIRPDAIIGDDSKIGNFVEIKKSLLDRDVKVSHLTYIGDASIGESTNVGAGTITCNYDGFHKHQTIIGKNAFVGSHSTLVAPVTIGDGAMIAAGSVITAHVPDDALGIGRGRQETKEQWAAEWRRRKRSRT